MPYYNVCPYCGDHLDPGERCDCLTRRPDDAEDKPATGGDAENGRADAAAGGTIPRDGHRAAGVA